MILIAGQNASFLVFTYALFKEICFSLNRNHVHEVKRVGGVVDAFVTEFNKKTIGNKLDVLTHEVAVHADEFNWKCVCDKFFFDFYRMCNDFLNLLLGKSIDQVLGIKQTCEIAMQALVSRDEFVREGKPWH